LGLGKLIRSLGAAGSKAIGAETLADWLEVASKSGELAGGACSHAIVCARLDLNGAT
jgi:hypothetical protein